MTDHHILKMSSSTGTAARGVITVYNVGVHGFTAGY